MQVLVETLRFSLVYTPTHFLSLP